MLNVVSRIDNTCQPYLYRGEDCMNKFVEQLTEIKKDIFEKMNANKPMDELTYEQKTEFRNPTHCSICNKKFQPDDTKVQDHCHFTGKYRGAAHVKCNLDYSFRYFKIPIFFHNLKNYDAHLIIARANELNIELNQNKRIEVTAQNSEKFITFSFGACEFKDSFAFLTASLDKLVRLNKYEGNEKIKDWETRFRYTSTNPYIKSKTDLNLLTHKYYIHTTIWIHGINLTKQNYQRKKTFTVNYTKKTQLTKTTPEQILCGNILTQKNLVNIMIYIWWLMYIC